MVVGEVPERGDKAVGPGPGSAKIQNRWGPHPRVGSSHLHHKILTKKFSLQLCFIFIFKFGDVNNNHYSSVTFYYTTILPLGV